MTCIDVFDAKALISNSYSNRHITVLSPYMTCGYSCPIDLAIYCDVIILVIAKRYKYRFWHLAEKS